MTRSPARPFCRLGITLAVTLAALGVTRPLLAGPTPGAYTTWFLAEGSIGFFDEEILIGNPNPAAALVTVSYLRQDDTPIEQRLTVPATSRATIVVKNVPGLTPGTNLSAVVTCLNGLDLVVERSMYWQAAGRRSGHNATGVTSAAPRWFLAEGATGAFDDFVLVANPNPTPATIRVTYLRLSSDPIVQAPFVLPARSRSTIWVNHVSPETAYAELSTLVEADVPVVVERAMYLRGGPAGHVEWTGGTGSAGIVTASRSWLLPEGFTGAAPGGGTFDTFVLLANPADTATDATVTFFTDAGREVVRSYTLAPSSRTTVWPNWLRDPDGSRPLANAAFSTRIDSRTDIVVERAMYWGDGTTWWDGHDAVGLTSRASAWAFAEGIQGRPSPGDARHDSYFLVLNDADVPLSLRATFTRDDGTGVVRTYEVAARTRFTLAASQVPELSNHRFAAYLETTSGVPFTAERAVYWGAAFEGGHASPGVPWTGAIATPPAPPLPTIRSVSPVTGPSRGGTVVRLVGTEFGEDTTVRFGTVAAASVTVTSATTLQAVAPPGTARATVDVAVTTNHHTVVAPRAFTYASDAEPLVFSATPAAGPTTGGTVVEVSGEQLIAPISATLGGVAVPVTIVNASHVRITTPPHAAGPVSLTVTTAGGSATLTDAFVFTSTSAPRRILAFGDSVTAGLTAGTPGDGGYPVRLQGLLASRYPTRGIRVDNAGVSGECISATGCNGVETGGEERFPTVLRADHDTLVLLDGVNDLSAGLDAADALASVRRVIVDAQLSGRRVVLVSLVPGTGEPAGLPAIQAFNASLAGLAGERGIPYVDVYTPLAVDPDLMSSDDLHPTDAGYDLIAELVFDAIVAHFGSLP